MNKLTLMLVPVALVAMSAPAFADDPTAVGIQNTLADWTQVYNEAAPTFDQFEWIITTPGVTWGSAFTDLPAGWSSVVVGNDAIAYGSPTTSIDFTAAFNTPDSNPFQTEFVAFAPDGSIVDSGDGYYPGNNAGNFIWSDLSDSLTETSVPDGGTTLTLLGLATLGLAGIRRKLSI